MKTQGYYVHKDTPWLNAAKFANYLTRRGTEVLWSKEGYFAPREESVKAIADKLSVALAPAEEAPRGEVYALGAPRVALYGCGAPCNYARLLSSAGFDCYFISDSEVRNGKLKYYDALVVPGGGMRAMEGQLLPLGKQGVAEIQKFTRDGGMYMSSCAGSCNAAIMSDDFNELHPISADWELINAKIWNSAGKDKVKWPGLIPPGIGVISARTVADHPVMWGMPETFDMMHYNGPIFDLAPLYSVDGASNAIGLTSWDKLTDRFTPSEQYFPSEKTARYAGELAAEQGKFGSVLGFLDQGKVVLFGSHPEFGFSALMDDIQLCGLMAVNALLWHSGTRKNARVDDDFHRDYHLARGMSIVRSPESNAELFACRISEVREYIARYKAAGEKSPEWLDIEKNISQFGKSPQEVWDEIYDALPEVLAQLEKRFAANEEAAAKLRCKQSEAAANLAVEWYDAIHYKRDDAWQQDYGYHGILKQLDIALDYFKQGEPYLETPRRRPDMPYDDFDNNPYLLSAGLYISSAGSIGNALLIAEMYASKFEMFGTSDI